MDINQPAPGFELPDLTGTLHRLSDERGRIVIVNFWSAECPWAGRADADLVNWLPPWGGRVSLLTIAANATESEEMVSSTARTRSLPLVLRGSSQVIDAYGARTTPHIFIVDADGILRYRGAFDDVTFRQRTPSRSYTREAVEDLLAGHLPDPAETEPYGCTIVRFMLE